MIGVDERVDMMVARKLEALEVFATVVRALREAGMEPTSAVMRADGSVAVVVRGKERKKS